jgi:hypothetical protein
MKRPSEWFYGLMTIVGVAGPWWFNVEWMRSAPATGFFDFFRDAASGPAATSISVDIGVVFACFAVWLVVESRRLGMRWTWLLIPYAALVALASAFPLFLLLRSRRLRATESSE